VVGGGAGLEMIRFTGRRLAARRRRLYPTEAEIRHDNIEVVEQNRTIAQAELEMARQVNGMAMETLRGYQGELANFGARVTAMEIKLAASETEQTRLKGLLRQAVSVLRDFMDIAAEHDIPAPEIPEDLKAEIEKG
jgi:hypothetical protein